MASAYSTFAGGIHCEPYSVERVERVNYGESEAAYDHRIGGRRVLTGIGPPSPPASCAAS